MTKRARLDADPLDAACRALRELARERGLYGIEVLVRGDGYIFVGGYGDTGFHRRASLDGDGPLPSEVLRGVVK